MVATTLPAVDLVTENVGSFPLLLAPELRVIVGSTVNPEPGLVMTTVFI